MSGLVRVGTSGWSYDHWAGAFYPPHLPADKRLPYYSTRFPSVEINATFYRLPSDHAVRAWADEVPPGFVFSVKGSRFITHYRQLIGAREAAETFLSRVGLLGEKLEVVLWQLPPTLTADADALDGFLGIVGRLAPVRHAVEFRHESWLRPEVFSVLAAHNAAHVHVSSDKMPEDLTPTADFVYVRFHGTARYHGEYVEPALEPWCDFLREQARLGRDGYAYFNNDAEAHAPHDAERLTAMLGEFAARVPAGATGAR